MSKVSAKIFTTYFFVFAAIILFFPWLSYAGVTPNTVDFGEVLVNTSKSAGIVIQNEDTQYSIEITCSFSDGTLGFGTNILRPVLIPPGGKQDLEVTFTPVQEGPCFDYMSINYSPVIDSTDSTGRTGTVARTELAPQGVFVIGNGIKEDNPTIEGLLEYFNESVEKGVLVGEGKGKSAEHRLNAFGKMLENAEAAINAGDIDEGLEYLRAAYRKINVFVKDAEGAENAQFAESAGDSGDAKAIPELKKMIEYLLENPV